MKTPPNKCLFCLAENRSFTRVEHIIPESLGNDDTLLEAGFVCDICNQYFGSKIENVVINAPPFGVERVAFDIKTKKGKHPFFDSAPHFQLYPTNVRDQIAILGSVDFLDHLSISNRLILPNNREHDTLTARLLLKIGLELLVDSDAIDPYEPRFDLARRYARAPKSNDRWQMSYGVFPYKDELSITRYDSEGPIHTEQLYRYEIGMLSSGDIILSFMYRSHLFGCNLLQPDIDQYVKQFSAINAFPLQVIETSVIPS